MKRIVAIVPAAAADSSQAWRRPGAGSRASATAERGASSRERTVVALVLVLAACLASLSAAPPARAYTQGDAIVNAAAAKGGTPYCWAGGNTAGPTHGSGDFGNGGCPAGTVGVDCSGLALYAGFQ